MKNKIIRDRFQALTALSSRVLPSSASVNKVATLLTTRFQQPYEATEILRKAAIAKHPLPDGYEGESVPMAIAELRQADIDEALELSTPVRAIPERLRLTADDMPKVLKREGGEGNGESVAAIIVMLGSLYVRRGDELLDAHGDDVSGEEPDEAVPAPIDPLAPAASAMAE